MIFFLIDRFVVVVVEFIRVMNNMAAFSWQSNQSEHLWGKTLRWMSLKSIMRYTTFEEIHVNNASNSSLLDFHSQWIMLDMICVYKSYFILWQYPIELVVFRLNCQMLLVWKHLFANWAVWLIKEKTFIATKIV